MGWDVVAPLVGIRCRRRTSPILSNMKHMLEKVQLRTSTLFASALIGEQVPPEDLATIEDPGLFGPSSVAWQVQSDTATLIGGFRSLLFQTLHPLAIAAVADHSVMHDDPLGRFRRTVRFVLTTTIGNTEAAERQIALVNRIHAKIDGTTPDGRPYSASDSHLLLWVHATEVDSFLTAYNLYGADPLTARQQDRYVGEMAQIAVKLGVADDDVPTSVAELDRCLDAFRPECEYGNEAREGVKFLLEAPMSPIARTPYAVFAAAAIDSMPTWVNEMMGVEPKMGVGPLLVRPTARATVDAVRWAATNPEHQRQLEDLFGPNYAKASN